VSLAVYPDEDRESWDVAERRTRIGFPPEEHHVPTTSWLGTVWSLRGAEQEFVGRIHAIDGDVVTLAVVGRDGATPEWLEVFPTDGRGARLARIRSATLLGKWTRVDRGETVPA
jgi:hypothetical protein